MKKFLLAIAVSLVSLSGMAQQLIKASVKKDTDPTKIDILLNPNYSHASGEYVFYFQFSVAIPAAGNSLITLAPATSTTPAVGINGFSNMANAFTIDGPWTEGDELVYNFVYQAGAAPSPNNYAWTNGTEFTGVQITFSGTVAGPVKILDFTNNVEGYGGSSGNTFYALYTSNGGAKFDLNSGLFYASTCNSVLGNYPVEEGFDQYSQTQAYSAGTVSGTTPLCIGATAQYTNSGDAGGTWSSSNTAVATVNATSGLVTATGAGTTNITYTVCSSSAFQLLTVTGNPSAGTVSGASPLCIGGTATYSSAGGSAGGTWSSSNSSVATINSSTGAVTASGAGTTAITYTVLACNGNPLTSSANLTVNPNASAGTVSGTSPLCIGAMATYSKGSGDAGGSWSSSNTSVATVDASTGVVTAAGAGTTTITYTVTTGCNPPSSASQPLTVNPNASAGAVSGTSPLCIGAMATYSKGSGDAGGSWSSSNTSVATVDASTGVVTAAGSGTTTITYTVSAGCNNPVSASNTLTVNPNASAGTVSGTSPLCIGAMATYSKGSGDAGGTWSSSNTAVATVNASTGVVTAAGSGTTTITYTVSAGCNSPVSASNTLTVNPNASAGTVSGTSPLCIGAMATYSKGSGDAGGTWSSSNTSVATVDSNTGVVTAAGSGTTTITYTVSAGCNNPVSASANLTVSPNASAGTVSGTSPLCIGAMATYSKGSGDAGGTWSSSNTSVATVDASTGVVTAAGSGTTTITYTVSAGCNNPVSASNTLTVNPNASAGTVSGTSPLCIGAMATYSKGSGDAGGTWSSSNTAVATVNASTGVVTAAGSGTTTITYTVSAGCNNPVSASANLTVSPNASAGTVSGASSMCINQSATYTSTGDTGGSWSSSNTSVATVDASTGLVNALGNGTTTITYTVSAGCNNPVSASQGLSVGQNANAGTVNGASPLCIEIMTTYTSTGDAGGTWSSSNTAVATVGSSTGVVTAISAGTTTITYLVSAGCNSPVSASATLTVNTTVNSGMVSGNSPLCIGGTATYSGDGDTGGSWSSSNTAVATVNASTGLVTATGAGTTSIIYTINSGCGSPASSSAMLTVSPNASAGTVSGTSPLCIGGTAAYISTGGDAGGSWSSSNTDVATVDGSGNVTALSAGTTTITYTVTTGCNPPSSASQTLTVNPNVNAGTVTGTSTLCIGATATYNSNGDMGGSWSSSNTAVATVNASSGVVTATGAGTATITYTVSGCNGPASASAMVTVNPNANAGTVSGTSPLCIGSSATYSSDGNTGGTWSSSNTSVATVDASTGVVTAAGSGTTNITYTVTAGCNAPFSASATLTVSPNASAGTVSGATPLCINGSATYSSSGDSGGSWSSSNMAVATVNALTGAVSALSAGTTTITYTVTTGCNPPSSASQTLTVSPNANPGTVSGASPLCIGATAAYGSNGDVGGTWISSNTAVATVDATTGVVTAVGSGTTVIIYTVGICNPSSSVRTLVVNPNADPGTVSGTSPMCIGTTATYSSDGQAGGTWSSSNTSVATVDASTGAVTAVGGGTTAIIYTVNTGCNTPLSASYSLVVSENVTINAPTITQPGCAVPSGTIEVNASGTGNLEYSLNGGAYQFSNTFSGLAPGNYNIAVISQLNPDCVSNYSGNPVVINTAPVVPSVDPVPGQTVFTGTMTSTITFSGPVAGTDFSWTNSDPSIGLASSGIGDIAGFTAINNTTVPVNATITVTPSFTNAGGTCTGTPYSFIIKVNPPPVYVHASVKKDADPTKINIEFTPTYSSATGEYVNYFQFSVAIPAAGNSGVTATATGVNAFQDMGTLFTDGPYVEGSELVYNFLYINPTAPNPNNYGWTNGTPFTGVVVTFSTSNAALVGKMVDFTNNMNGYGGANGNTFYGIVTSAGDKTDYPNLFYSIPSLSATGNYPAGEGSDQYVQTTSCNGANGGTASGTVAFCVSGTPTITATGYSTGPNSGYQWQYSSDNFGSDINDFTGQVNPDALTTGVVTSTTYYRLMVTCPSGTATAYSNVITVTVNPNVNAGIVTGASPLCIGAMTLYSSSSATSTGNWSSSNTAVATVNSTTGMVTAVSAGTTNIIYTISSGCGAPASASATLTVNPNANAGMVSGASPLCINGTATYADNGDTGGSWSSSNSSVATVDASTGAVTAMSAGTTTITYTVSTGCNSPVSASQTLTVNPNATAGTVSGTSPLCIGGTATYTASGNSATGAWSSSNTAVATVNATTGLVTATGAGTANIIYTVTAGCNGPATASQTLTVNPNVSAGTVSGTTPLCIGATATYTASGTAGGTWSSSNTSVATVNASTGLVTAMGAGTANITYTVTGCGGTSSSLRTLTVSPNVSAGTVSGTSPLCIGATATYTSSGTAGGSWSSSNTSVATVNASTGVVTATGAGTANITYTVTGCGGPVSATRVLTVNPNATAGTVSGTTPLCIGGTATYTVSGNSATGTWSSSSTAVATVNATTGLVTAVSAGTTNITYTVTTGCNAPATASRTLTVNPNVAAGTVSGTTPMCIGATATYTASGTAGGTWSSSNTSVATVNASTGLVTAMGAGTANITYTVTGCGGTSSALKALTVSPNVIAGTVSGATPLCLGTTATYSVAGNSVTGTWSSSNTSVATVNASGLVTATGAGTASITYTVTGCGGPLSASSTLTVNGPFNILSTTGAGGTISPLGNTPVTCNGRQTYTITPNNCYKILDVLVDGVSNASAIMNGTYTFNNVLAAHTIAVTFTPAGPYNIVLTATGSGTTVPVAPNTAVVACGGSQAYSFSASAGNHIGTVLIDLVNNPAAVTSGTYTFTNVQANHTIQVNFVSNCTPTTVTITANSNAFCANLTLTANPAAPGTYTYQWYRNGTLIAGATSQTLALTGYPNSTGSYTVTASASTCTSPQSPAYVYNSQTNVLQSYTILGTDQVQLGDYNTVLHGSVGNTKSDGQIQIGHYGWVNAPGSFVKASKLNIDNTATVGTRILAPATATLPTMIYNTTSTNNLPNLNIQTNGTYTGNYNDIQVKNGVVATLTGTTFHNIQIQQGAKVTFTAGTIYLYQLNLQNGNNSSTPTKAIFNTDCNLIMHDQLQVQQYCQLNPTSKNVVIYLDADAQIQGRVTYVTASIYDPNHNIHAQGDDNGSTYMTGRFIAKQVQSDGKNVIWDYYDCANPPAPLPLTAQPPVTSMAPQPATDGKQPSVPATQVLDVKAYPNPSANRFNLKLTSSDLKGMVYVRILDMSGRLIQELKGTPDQIFQVGGSLVQGMYIAELRQGTGMVTVKLIKQ